MQEVKEIIKGYILEEFLPGENPAELTELNPAHYWRDPRLACHDKAGGISRGTV